MHRVLISVLLAGGLVVGCDGGGGMNADVGAADRGPADSGWDDRGAADSGWDDSGAADSGADARLATRDAAPDPGLAPPAPLITEFVARNDTGLVDDRGRTSDWIELYNPHPVALDLGGFGLSDHEDADPPWVLPDRTLEPGQALVVFASGDDVAGPDGALHADFRLDADGEPLSLVDPRGVVRQRFEAAPRAADVAYGLPAAVLLAAGAEARYRPVGPDGAWTAPGFADDDWATGPTGFGRDPGGPASALDPWADALASHWTFDRIAEAPDGSVLAFDGRGGSGRHLRLEAAARLVDGREGQAMTGGFARALEAQGFDFETDFTWALWIAGQDASGALIARNAPGIAWSRGAKALFVRGGDVWFDAGWVGAPQTGAAVDDGVWHHVAVTWRAADDRMVIYVDGAPRYDRAFDANAFPEDLDDPPVREGLFVGGTDFTGGLPDLGPYDGRIDAVSLWRAALPPEAVALLFEGAAPPARGPFADLIATEVPDADGVQLRMAFDAPDGVAAAVVRLRFDDRAAAWLDGAPVVTLADGPRADGRARTPTDAVLPPLDPGRHLLAVRAQADPGDPERWVISPEVWALEASVAALVRPTPGAFNAAGRAPAVRIEPPEGVVSDTLEVRLSAPGDGRPAVIHYTLDGRTPTGDDPIYDRPLALDGPATVRAVALAPGRAPGPVASASFTGITPDLSRFTSTVPVVVIDRGGQGLPRRGVYGEATLAAWMPGADGLTRLQGPPALVSRAAIRVRGQSSSGAPKAPYRIELRDGAGRDRAEPLLGLPADADWVLHGPYWDKSLIRNALVYGLGRDLGLQAPRTVAFELFVRGEDGRVALDDNRGVYLLVERIELGPQRLDLPGIEPTDDAEPAIAGGWLLKFEASVAEAPVVPGWDSLEVVEPGDPTPIQMDWVEAAVAGFDDALDAPDRAEPGARWRALVDTRSVTDLLIVNELFRDQDAYVRSSYLHRDRGGPWVMGPLWDYNLVAGVGGFFDNTAIAGWQFRHGYNAGEHRWFVRMMDDPAFAEATAARWRALRRGLLSDAAIAERVAALTVDLAGPAARNFAIWRNLRAARIEPFATVGTETWDGQIEALLGWLIRRAAWLDAQWAL